MSERKEPFFPDLEKSFQYKEVEERWSSLHWEQCGTFHAESSGVTDRNRKPFTVLMPPPNVTGSLTLGHVLNHTLQDIFVRYHRMNHREALWLPGTDHAGIATQTVVERKLKKEGVTRHELGREVFLDHVWQWRHEYGDLILRQLRRLGISCDWRRHLFTMDASASEAVTGAFVSLYRDGLVYRGARIINWCPVSQTALSDEEVVMKTRRDQLVYVRYALADDPEQWVTIATVRPETILADVAVAVNPSDPRYAMLVGRRVVVPIANREVPIITDEYVDIAFGTGALKITPAHDANDYAIGTRHGLPHLSVIGKDGLMTDDCGYAGMDRFETRKAIVHDLTALGCIERVEEYEHNVGYSERADVVVEPRLSEQWFVRMKPLAERALRVVEDGEIRFHPAQWLNTYRHWMDNIQDWCISRQIWWGHRVPAWYDGSGNVWVAQTFEEACRLAGTDDLHRDEDVLDTWFSSWLWPLTTLGWVSRESDSEDLRTFYPTSTLVTGPDIIFFWVARMIMAGLYFRGDVPFRDVYFTSIIRDMKGRKLSKSLGNSPDPVKVMDTYGTDALRFTIIYIAPLGQDVLFGEEKCELGRNFATKIWNATRLIFMQRERWFADAGEFERAFAEPLDLSGLPGLPEEWLLVEFHRTVAAVHAAFAQFRMFEMVRLLHDFFWRDFCDWYLEALKTRLSGSVDVATAQRIVVVALRVLEGSLQMLHPVMPFITDEIWHHIVRRPTTESIALTTMPSTDAAVADRDVSGFELLRKVVGEIRSLRSLFSVPHKAVASVVVRPADAATAALLQANGDLVEAMAQCSLVVDTGAAAPAHAAAAVIDGHELFVLLEGLISFDQERQRLEKEIASVSQWVATLDKKLSNRGFMENAAPDVVAKEVRKREEALDNLTKLQKILSILSA